MAGAWDGYLNDNVTNKGQVDKAVLIDLTGASVWGQSGTQISPPEMSQFAAAFNNASSAQENGIQLGGTKYFFNKIEEIKTKDNDYTIPVLHCARGKEGIIAAKCGRSLLVTHHSADALAPNAISFVIEQAKHLIKHGC